MQTHWIDGAMNVLVLDDSIHRQKLIGDWVRDQIPGCFVRFSDDADDAIKALNERDYDLVMLDHDLGDRFFVDSDDPNTGYRVAKHMSETNKKAKCVIIHSLNVHGAKNINHLIPEAKMIPITLLKDCNLIVK